MKKTLLALLCLTLVPALTACFSKQPVPRFASIGFDEGALDGWTHVLQEYVNEVGEVDYAGLRSHPEPLERYVTWIAHNGPYLSPNRMDTREELLAFYINAYNALSMYNVVVSGWEPDQKLRFFKGSRMRIDGQYMSLDKIEKELIRPLGEPRVYFGLNPMTAGGPRLRREPFLPEIVDDQLERSAVEFFNDPKYVSYDPSRNRVRVHKVLDDHKKDFLRDAPTLIAYANRYRANPLPDNAKVKTASFDWSLNAQ